MKVKKIIFISIAILFLAISCNKNELKNSSGKIKVAITVITYGDFAKQIGGEFVDLILMVPPGSSCEAFDPSAEQLRDLSDAKIYLQVGGDYIFETELLEDVRSIYKNLNIVDCSRGIKIQNKNFHFWLGPDEVKTICKHLLTAFIKELPAREKLFTENYNKFISKIDSVDELIKNDLGKLDNKLMIVFHPAWQYFANHYGIREISIEQEGKNPGAKELQDLIQFAMDNKIKTIFVEPQFDKSAAQTIAKQLNAKVVELNPLPENFLMNSEDVASKIKNSLSQ